MSVTPTLDRIPVEVEELPAILIPYKCEHCNIPLKKVKDLYVLSKIEKTSGGKVRLDIDRGVPVVTYICPNCGKFTIFSARKLGEI
ncbi:MAG: hypothetical protein AB1414_07080 [bacterium]